MRNMTIQRRAAVLEPASEMSRIIGKCVDIRSADIEQMVRMIGAIGGAIADTWPLLDQRDADVAGSIAKQVTRE